jgi:hypothetical protein
MLNITHIVENSGDSVLSGYEYSVGVLAISLDLSDIDMKVLIKIKTDSMLVKNYYLNKVESLYRTCRIEIQELPHILAVKDDIYIPPTDFGKLMSEKRSNYHLAYGEKTTTVKYLFSLVGYDRFISCIVLDLDCITIEEIS